MGGGLPSLSFSLFFSAILCANALPFGSGLFVPSATSNGLPPALACASSTRVRPRGASPPPLLAFAVILFLAAILVRSSLLPDLPFVRLLLRVGEVGALFSLVMRFVEEGILESRRLGDVGRSLRAVLLDCGRRSGALDNVGNDGAVAALPAAKILD